MKTTISNLKKYLCFALLVVCGFSVLLTAPAMTMAQNKSIFSDHPKSDPNDDTQLCTGPLTSDKYCVYYREYIKNEETNPDLARIYRNKMLYVIKEQIDEYYDSHKNGRKVKNKWFQTVLDVLGIGAALAANITNGERAKSVIAASLGAFQAGRNSINDRFQLLQLQILVNKMNANRATQWTNIYQNMELDIKAYSWDRARTELQQYLFRGTFNDALDSLVEETGAEVVQAKMVLSAFTDKQIQSTDNFFDKIKGLKANLAATATEESATKCLRAIVAALQMQKEPKFKSLDGFTQESKGKDILNAIISLSRDLAAADTNNAVLINKLQETVINTCKN